MSFRRRYGSWAGSDSHGPKRSTTRVATVRRTGISCVRFGFRCVRRPLPVVGIHGRDIATHCRTLRGTRGDTLRPRAGRYAGTTVTLGRCPRWDGAFVNSIHGTGIRIRSRHGRQPRPVDQDRDVIRRDCVAASKRSGSVEGVRRFMLFHGKCCSGGNISPLRTG